MLVRLIKWFGIVLALSLTVFAFYWWIQLPYHNLPVTNANSSKVMGEVAQPTYSDVPYAAKSRFQKLDLYLPETGEGPFPLVVWIHGGGLIMGDKSSMPQTDFGPAPIPKGPYGPYQVQVPDVDALNAQGYAVASLNYRLGMSPITAATSAIKDCKAAIRFLRKHSLQYKVDPTRIAVWGNSMGGYLAAMLGVTGDRLTSYDEDDLADTNISSAVNAVIVWYGAEDRMPGEQLSLEYQAAQSRNLPSFLIVNGDIDPVVTVEQASKLHSVLERVGAESTLIIVPGAGHEDPLFSQTQMRPSLEFLKQAFLSYD